jgi:hypothetical protein
MVHHAFARPTIIAAFAVAAILVSGCQALGTGAGGGEKPGGDKTSGTAATPGTAGAAGAATPNYQPVTDIPIPSSTRINTERSTILGNGDRWFGRMILVLDRPTTQAFAYYQEQMGTFGWEAVTAVQGKVSTLSFTRGDRAATVEIAPSGLRSSEVAVTVSPRQPPAPRKP